MRTEEMMNTHERRKYLRIVRARYLAADRRTKGDLLDEMEAVTHLDRKTLIRLMHTDLEQKRRSRERGPVYNAEFRDAVQVIAETLDYPCAERLQPALLSTARHLATHEELVLTPRLEQLLGQVSISTLKRTLARISQDRPRLRRRPPHSQGLAQSIPMLRLPWDERRPGFLEGDLVHHCGSTTAGDYVHTLLLVDIATGWCEPVAILGRSFLVVRDAFRRILARLPFPMRALHFDNGSEFLNHHLLRFFGQVLPEVQISRSRPHHKNDNRFVEQRNSHLIRDYLGYIRLDSVAQTLALNRIYDQMWLYHNLFQPALRLVEKEVRPQENGSYRLRYRYDRARTPLERLFETGELAPQSRQYLEALYDHTNPRLLRQTIHEGLEQLFELSGALPGQEDVRLTLYTISQPAGESPGDMII